MKPSNQQADIKFNYYDYTLLPEDKRYELIEGDLFMTLSPITLHQLVSMRLEHALSDHVHKKKSGLILVAPIDVVLSDEDVVQPDILFISRERKGIVGEKNIQGAPDLVVEILSPTTADRDLVIKKKLYAKFAVKEYWICNPSAKTVEVMTWTDKGFKTVQVYPENGIVRSEILPDFSVPVSPLFEEPFK